MANDISNTILAGTAPPGQVEALSRPQEIRADRSEKAAETAEELDGNERQSIDEVVSGLNKMVQNLHRNLQFSVDDESGETIIKVVDSETREVVRQIPSEEIVRLRQRMKDAAGVLFQGAV